MRLNLFRFVFIVTLLAVLVLALLPDREVDVGFTYDKLNHVAAFLVLGVLFCLAWPEIKWCMALGVLLLVGVSIEVAQHFVGRDASFWDVVADAVGLGLSALVGHFPGWRRVTGRS